MDSTLWNGQYTIWFYGVCHFRRFGTINLLRLFEFAYLTIRAFVTDAKEVKDGIYTIRTLFLADVSVVGILLIFCYPLNKKRTIGVELAERRLKELN